MSTNIVKDYAWTAVPKGSQLRSEAPTAYVRAYKLNQAALTQFLNGYVDLAKGVAGGASGNDFYKNLYKAEQKETYFFPYFNDSFRSFSTNFANTFSNVSDRGGQATFADKAQSIGGELESFGGMAAEPANAFQGKPQGSYIETPKFYQYSNTDNGLQIGFTLSNTLEDDSIDKNFKFICDFTKMNRPYRYGPIGMDFPAIYNLVVPGLRYIQWAYLENFEVSLLGNRRRIGTRVIPEAYVCNFTFKSLTVEPANFVDEICDNRDAFGDFDSYAANQKEEEKGFQKGKYERERTLNTRSKLAKAIQQGEVKPSGKEPDISMRPTPSLIPGTDGTVIINGSGVGTAYHRRKYKNLYADGNGGGAYTGVFKDPNDFYSLTKGSQGSTNLLDSVIGKKKDGEAVQSSMSPEQKQNILNYLKSQPQQKEEE